MVDVFKYLLFGSAYSPLFTLILLHTLPSINLADLFPANIFDILRIGNLLLPLLLSFIPIICAWFFGKYLYRRSAETTGIRYFYVKQYEDKTQEVLSYIIPYIISLMTVSILDLNSILSIIVLLVLLYPIYANSSMIYINPVLALMGYRLYNVTVEHPEPENSNHGLNIMLITRRKKIQNDTLISLHDISTGIYLETEEKK